MNEKYSIQDRRSFLRTITAASAGAMIAPVAIAQTSPARKIKLGVVGCGGRGAWIARLFKEHGGYELHAVADYFQEVADKCGDELGVDKARRFSTLSGYKRLLESGVEAVALEVMPYFFPEQAMAAVQAGKHVYMAKPIASDVPGALKVLHAGENARKSKQVFMVDYQMPTDPANIEVVRRIHANGLGKLAHLYTSGVGSGRTDPPFTENYESRMQNLLWLNDTAAGCGFIGNFDIHAVDAALWVARQRPVAATGISRICRPNPHGDSHDVTSVTYEYEGGLAHTHIGQALKNFLQGELSCRVQGVEGHAMVHYWGRASFRSGEDGYAAEVANLYETGARRNIATYHKDVSEGRFENPTLERSVDGVLACVLGREAAARRTRLPMRQLLSENKRFELNLKGLKT